MAGDLDALDEVIAKLRELETVASDVAPEVAREAKRLVGENIAAGRGPDGTAWEPRKDGEKPLQNAAQAVTATASGSRVVLTVSGPEARHHQGRAKGGVVREILPRKKVPGLWIEAIRRVVKRHVEGL